MIVQVKLRIETKPESFSPSLAYPLYAWLLSHLSFDEGNRLHEQGTRSINQHLWLNPQTKEVWWTVNLLNSEAIDLFYPILETEKKAQLHSGVIHFASHEVKTIDSPQALIKDSERLTLNKRFPFELVTPTSFKQNGRYVIFPQESLILQSLITRWGLCFPDMPLNDGDAVEAMLKGLHITDYRLKTLRYPMKQTKIPSFVGCIVLETHLPSPLLDVFKTLYCFAPYAGIGIKTALGMGGIQIQSAIEQSNC